MELRVKKNILGFSVFISGALCVVLAAKGNIWNFIFGIYTSIGYSYISFKNGHFAEAISFAGISVPVNTVSFFGWKKKTTKKGIVQMRRMKTASSISLFLFLLVLCLGTWPLLKMVKKQDNPLLDGSTVVLSNAARILRMLRYREQWSTYFFLNILEIIKWSCKIKVKSHEAPMMVVSKVAYFINSIYAYHNWTKGSERAQKKKN